MQPIDTLERHTTKHLAQDFVNAALAKHIGDSDERNWRLLTFPAKQCNYERALLSSPLGKNIKDIIGLEAKTSVARVSKRTARKLHSCFRKTRFSVFHTTDYHFWQPANLGGSKNDNLRGNAGLGQGFDMIWLDWMQCWSKGTRNSLSAMAQNIDVFERAWAQQRPGLLFITLCVGGIGERKVELEHLAHAMWDMDLPADPCTNNPIELARLRFQGVAAWLNQHTRAEGADCIPVSAIQYREPGAHCQPMMLMGFDVKISTLSRAAIAGRIEKIKIRRGFET